MNMQGLFAVFVFHGKQRPLSRHLMGIRFWENYSGFCLFQLDKTIFIWKSVFLCPRCGLTGWSNPFFTDRAFVFITRCILTSIKIQILSNTVKPNLRQALELRQSSYLSIKTAHSKNVFSSFTHPVFQLGNEIIPLVRPLSPADPVVDLLSEFYRIINLEDGQAWSG